MEAVSKSCLICTCYVAIDPCLWVCVSKCMYMWCGTVIAGCHQSTWRCSLCPLSTHVSPSFHCFTFTAYSVSQVRVFHFIQHTSSTCLCQTCSLGRYFNSVASPCTTYTVCLSLEHVTESLWIMCVHFVQCFCVLFDIIVLQFHLAKLLVIIRFCVIVHLSKSFKVFCLQHYAA